MESRAETFRAEKQGVIADFLGLNFQHEAFNHHFFNAGFEISVGHEGDRNQGNSAE